MHILKVRILTCERLRILVKWNVSQNSKTVTKNNRLWYSYHKTFLISCFVAHKKAWSTLIHYSICFHAPRCISNICNDHDFCLFQVYLLESTVRWIERTKFLKFCSSSGWNGNILAFPGSGVLTKALRLLLLSSLLELMYMVIYKFGFDS